MGCRMAREDTGYLWMLSLGVCRHSTHSVFMSLHQVGEKVITVDYTSKMYHLLDLCVEVVSNQTG